MLSRAKQHLRIARGVCPLRPDGESYTPGANRNALLLDTLGEGVAWADDDTLAELAPVGGSSSVPRLCSDDGSLGEFWFGDQPVEVEPQCAFREHEGWLGKRVGAAVDFDTRVEYLSAGLLESVLRGEARVVATWLGLRGDSGSDDPPPTCSCGDRAESA